MWAILFGVLANFKFGRYLLLKVHFVTILILKNKYEKSLSTLNKV